MSATALVGSLIFALGALFLAWRGVDHLPRATMFRYAAIWVAIIVGVVVVLKLAGA